MATKSAYGLCVNNWIHGPTQKTSRMPLILLNETLKARVRRADQAKSDIEGAWQAIQGGLQS